MKSIKVVTGTYLTSNLINDISQVTNSNISSIYQSTFNYGVIGTTSFPVEFNLNGNQMLFTVGSGKAITQSKVFIESLTNLSLTTEVAEGYLYLTFNKEIVNQYIENIIPTLYFGTTLPPNSNPLDFIKLGKTFSSGNELIFSYDERENAGLVNGMFPKVIIPNTNTLNSYSSGDIVNLEDHLKAIGNGTVSKTNPHGLSIRDIEGWYDPKLTNVHESQFHFNGLIKGNSSIISSTYIIKFASTYVGKRISLSSNTLLLLKGKTFGVDTFKTIDIFFYIPDSNLTASSGDYVFALDIDSNSNIIPRIFYVSSDNLPNDKTFWWRYLGDTTFTEGTIESASIYSNSFFDIIKCIVSYWDSSTKTFSDNVSGILDNINLLSYANDYHFVGEIILVPQNYNIPLGWTKLDGRTFNSRIYPYLNFPNNQLPTLSGTNIVYIVRKY